MKQKPTQTAAILLATIVAVLFWKHFDHREIDSQQVILSTPKQADSNAGINPATIFAQRINQITSPNSSQENQTPPSTNNYTITHSNVVVKVVTVDGPMESLIGTAQYELLAKNDFDDSVKYEPYLTRIRDLIESERPGSGRLYSAIRIVYETRVDVLDMRHKLFDLEFTSNATIGQIQSDSNLTEEEKKSRIQDAINNMNAQRMAYDVEARDNSNRLLRHMKTLVGELSEATLERFSAFEPRFSPGRLSPATAAHP